MGDRDDRDFLLEKRGPLCLPLPVSYTSFLKVNTETAGFYKQSVCSHAAEPVQMQGQASPGSRQNAYW